MRIGLVGTGNIGRPIAMNLLKAGFKLSVYARRKDAVKDLEDLGAALLSSPKEVASASDVFITCLPTPKDLEDVALGRDGLLAGAKKGDVLICMDTTDPSVVRRIEGIAAKSGVDVIDAPVSGGVEGAKAGTLTIMVGGNKDTVENCMKILEAVGKKIYHVGAVGSGNTVKLVNQMINMTNLIAALEGLVLGVKAGIEPKMLCDILGVSSANSYVMERKVPQYVLKGNFEPGFKISLACKDLRLAVDIARDLSVPVVLGNVVLQIFEYARASGLGNKDESAIIQLLEDVLKVKVRGANTKIYGSA